jgi:hypothetical protein
MVVTDVGLVVLFCHQYSQSSIFDLDEQIFQDQCPPPCEKFEAREARWEYIIVSGKLFLLVDDS